MEIIEIIPWIEQHIEGKCLPICLEYNSRKVAWVQILHVWKKQVLKMEGTSLLLTRKDPF